MSRPKLYLFIGYPGSGKTSVAKLIKEATGAVHLWADHERLDMFGVPTHSKAESSKLYEHLNHLTDQLLSEGKSVIFDTNFNFYNDRQYLREIADSHGAETIIVWVNTPKELAKKRAVDDANLRNGYEVTMSNEQFAAIADKLEELHKNEKLIKIDGTKIDKQELMRLLKL